MQDSGIRFFSEMLQTLTARGLNFLGRSQGDGTTGMADMAALLMSRRGEVSGIALARILLDAYAVAGADERRAFLTLLASDWGPEQGRMEAAIEAFRADPSPETTSMVHIASDPRRQELLRRLNMAPSGTRDLIAMRQDVMAMKRDDPQLAVLDQDFVHLFSSWFNRGFLHLRAIEWTTPANLLEKIIEYEAVHEISDWNELRARLHPADRRCFAFFHPQLPDEPLIFVEVALTREMSSRIDMLLSSDREVLPPYMATTAIFYSISNCQTGLAGVSFGSLLIKQVVDDLKHELPTLRNFATLSPVPGFAAWLARERSGEAQWMAQDLREGLKVLDEPDWRESQKARERVRAPLLAAAAHYFLNAKDRSDRPCDPVARFHLGNGARLEQLDFLGDPSPKGLRQSHGLMVNYLYALDQIERNHEAYAQTSAVVASPAIHRQLRPAELHLWGET